MVPVNMLEGEVKVPAPRITRTKRKKEIILNDLGYRMSWCQGRVFAGRPLFLQKSCKFCVIEDGVSVFGDERGILTNL